MGSKLSKKLDSKKAHHIQRFLRNFGLAFITLGGLFIINDNNFGLWFLTIGAIPYSIFYFILGLQEPREEINWELIFPELALGHSDDLYDDDDLNLTLNKEDDGRENN